MRHPKGTTRRATVIAGVFALLAAFAPACGGSEEDGVSESESAAGPTGATGTTGENGMASEELEGSDNGVSFVYRGGSVVVDLSDAPSAVQTQVIGREVSLECAGADITRDWRDSFGEQLRFQLTHEGAEPGEVPVEIDRCSLSAVPGGPLAEAEMHASG